MERVVRDVRRARETSFGEQSRREFRVDESMWKELDARLKRAQEERVAAVEARESLRKEFLEKLIDNKDQKKYNKVRLTGCKLFIPFLAFVGAFLFLLGIISTKHIDPEQPPRWFFHGDALAGMYLWLMFGFLSEMLACDLQRMLRQANFWWFQYIIAFLSFFFLIHIVTGSAPESFAAQLGQSGALLLVFVISTKAKAKFAIITILLLAVDQFLRAYSQSSGTSVTVIRTYVIAVLYAVIMYGAVDYTTRRTNFSFKPSLRPRHECVDQDLTMGNLISW